jgi:DNA-binding XRE family transcriptional regulator
MPTTSQYIGAKLKSARLAHKLTAKHVADKISITSQALYFIETGRNCTSIDRLADLCRLYDLRLIDILPVEMADIF